MAEYMQWLSGAFEYLVDMNMHPAVTLVVSLILLVSRVKFEDIHIQAAKDAMEQAVKATGIEAERLMTVKKAEEIKADQLSHYAIVIALLLSLIGQFTMYWPKSGQARALCVYYAFAQFGLAIMINFFLDKYGLIDRLGKYFQKKADDATK